MSIGSGAAVRASTSLPAQATLLSTGVSMTSSPMMQRRAIRRRFGSRGCSVSDDANHNHRALCLSSNSLTARISIPRPGVFSGLPSNSSVSVCGLGIATMTSSRPSPRRLIDLGKAGERNPDLLCEQVDGLRRVLAIHAAHAGERRLLASAARR